MIEKGGDASCSEDDVSDIDEPSVDEAGDKAK
jgi:hypothetical protein